MIQVRTVNPAFDFWRLPDLLNQVEPEPVTMDALFRWHFRESPGRIQRRVVAEDERGVLVGYGLLNWEDYLPPGEFYLWVMSHPERRGAGIGRALYADLMAHAERHPITALTSETNDNDPDSLVWAARRGFAVTRHLFASSLMVNTFDESPFAGVVERAESAGIRFATMADFPNTEPYQRRLYELNRETGLEIPNNDMVFPSFEAFKGNVFDSHWYQPEGQWMAVRGEEWVGMSAIRYIPENYSMYNNMTGVRRAYRGQGIALALKLLTIRYARHLGATVIRTHNDSANAPMLAINRKLGYVPEPGTYKLKRNL